MCDSLKHYWFLFLSFAYFNSFSMFLYLCQVYKKFIYFIGLFKETAFGFTGFLFVHFLFY